MEIKNISKNLKAISNIQRLKIIGFLKKTKSSNISEISDFLKLSYRSTDKHLQILKNVEIIISQNINGKQIYFLNKNQIGYMKNIIKIL